MKYILFWSALISSWVTFLFFFAIPFVLLFWIAALVYLFIKRTNLKWYLLFISSWTLVPFISFTIGSIDYFRGKAEIMSVGMPNAEFYNLDPDMRVWNSSSGCMVFGFEPFSHWPNNLAVRFWTGILGYQKGVYKGVYPTKEETREIMKRSQPSKLLRGIDTVYFSYNNQNLYITPNNNVELDGLDSQTTANVFVLYNECILLEPIGDTTRTVIMLADKNNGNLFAKYYE